MRIAILAEQNFNLIDGSTIWLLNLCKLVALQPDLSVVLVLSHRLTDRVLADELPAGVRIVDLAALRGLIGVDAPSLPAAFAAEALAAVETVEGRIDRVLVRGAALIGHLAGHPDWAARTIGYAPGVVPDVALPEPGWLTAARAARLPLIVQSAPARAVLESLCDYPAHVVHVVPPVVFDDVVPAPRLPEEPVSLCYSGKMDVAYGLDWLLDLCDSLGETPDLQVRIIAGKDTNRRDHPAFFARLDALRRAVAAGARPGVAFSGGLAHAAARAEMGRADFAWCLRHARYDDVIEISTKIVEFCTLGVAPILNDTALNRTLFGADYPYYVDPARDDIAARVRAILAGRGGDDHARARTRIAEVAARFSATELSADLGRILRGHDPGVPALATGRRRILIATHDAKFLRQFLDLLRGEPGITLHRQDWLSTTRPAGPPTVPADVDTVFCEWACENAVWHSRNKRPGTRLIVRLHRFEAFRDFPARIDWSAVDALIVVSDHFRDLMVEQHGVDPARVHVIPQYIDWHALRREKLPQARFTLGLVGINPFGHKRFDRAIDFLAALRAADPRFRLAVRSVMPWQIDWVWNREDETRRQFEAVFARIFADPALRDHVRFDPAGPDMEEWYRGIGTILSSSDSEGCHTSVMEAMASGATAVVHDWPGARGLFGPHVHAEMRDAIPGLIAFADAPDIDLRRRALSDSMARHDVRVFARAFLSL